MELNIDRFNYNKLMENGKTTMIFKDVGINGIKQELENGSLLDLKLMESNEMMKRMEGPMFGNCFEDYHLEATFDKREQEVLKAKLEQMVNFGNKLFLTLVTL